jgi:hypothetical protein
MRKYESDDHVRRLGASQFSEEDTNSCYFPHHVVWKGEREKRKIRVVFDASVRPETGKEFNKMAITGGQTQGKIAVTLISFRNGSIALTGDIQQMYPQIRIIKEQEQLQRILWRDSFQEEVF